MLTLATQYQAFGFNLVPLGNDKRPVVTGGTYINKRTGKEEPIRFRWQDWTEKKQPDNYFDKVSSFDWWADVKGLAAVCGPISGDLVCVDFDSAKSEGAVLAFLDALGIRNEWIVASPGGGYHVWLRCPGLNIPKGKLDRPGIDAAHVELRYTGHYVALPGSQHPNGGVYAFVGETPTEAPPVVAPETLLRAYDAVTMHEDASTPKTQENGATEVTEAYVRAALDAELVTLARTPNGSRNEQLNRSAFALGQLVADGLLSEDDVIGQLEAVALSVGLEEAETAHTILSGFRAGQKEPRGLRLKVYSNGHDAPDLNGSGDVQPAWDKPFDLYQYKAEDGGILDIWLRFHGDDWLWATAWETWLHWEGTHWQPDAKGVIAAQLLDLMKTLNDLAEEKLQEAFAQDQGKPAIDKALSYLTATKRTGSRLSSVERMIRPYRAIEAKEVDRGNLLNFQNCTLDLSSYEVRPHRREDVITYCLPYDYDENAGCPRWIQFLREVFVHEGTTEPDLETIQLFKELVGYALTNETHHEVMAWFKGEGGNGKTVAITIIQELLGPLSMTVNFHYLGEPGNYDLADVPGKRLIFSTESEKGRTIQEGLIKRLVSGEMIRAKAIYAAPFEFVPQAKIFWAANDMPVIKDTSNAIWRRLKLIPFHRVFTNEEKDIHLLDKLRAELSGILNWALWSLYDLRQRGSFTDAAAARAALDEFKEEANPVAQWLHECTEAVTLEDFEEYAHKRTQSKEAYRSYRLWCEQNGRSPLNNTNFGKEVKRLGVEWKKSMGAVQYAFTLNDQLREGLGRV